MQNIQPISPKAALAARTNIADSVIAPSAHVQPAAAAPFAIHERAAWNWPNFSPAEMACRHCAEGYRWPDFMDRLQQARDISGRPFRILSAHRCALHNARVGGAPLSQHLRLAADISLRGHNHRALASACKTAGFTGFGYYQSFLHIDLGPARMWHGGPKAKTLWQTL